MAPKRSTGASTPFEADAERKPCLDQREASHLRMYHPTRGGGVRGDRGRYLSSSHDAFISSQIHLYRPGNIPSARLYIEFRASNQLRSVFVC